ncbi:MAG: hypothetical protein KAS23_02190, partial [Anaerohalosphaera sp.]|nr:hypothetical protein [Anaerohalosphaera sp.]
DEAVYVGYNPIVDGVVGNTINAEAKKIDAEFIQLASGKTELSRFTASDGVYYEEEGGHIFKGDSIDLDNIFSEMIIKGTEKRPCSLDGVKVPIIRYNLFTGDLSTEMSNSPGVFVLPTGKKK